MTSLQLVEESMIWGRDKRELFYWRCFVENRDSFELLTKTEFDVVVNTAGTMPAHANRDMMPCVQSIVVGTVNVVEWMKKNK